MIIGIHQPEILSFRDLWILLTKCRSDVRRRQTARDVSIIMTYWKAEHSCIGDNNYAPTQIEPRGQGMDDSFPEEISYTHTQTTWLRRPCIVNGWGPISPGGIQYIIIKSLQLKEIQKILNVNTKGKVADLSQKFYSYIPHNKMNTSNLTINTLDMVKQKLELIDDLIDIKMAHKVVKQDELVKLHKVNPLDEKYAQLNCQLTTLKSSQQEFQMIERYLENTKGDRILQILDIFMIERREEIKQFNPKKIGNKMLLWHGSRFYNFGGILSQGLRIAPPEAPKSGFLFGKGIYFTDMVDKSAPYTCYYLSGEVGLFLLCEVALGKMRELYETDQDADDNLPKTSQSTRGIGTKYPDPKESRMIDKNVMVPLGKTVKNDDPKAYRGHNEFIVYNSDQVKMRYLVKVKFN